MNILDNHKSLSEPRGHDHKTGKDADQEFCWGEGGVRSSFRKETFNSLVDTRSFSLSPITPLSLWIHQCDTYCKRPHVQLLSFTKSKEANYR